MWLHAVQRYIRMESCPGIRMMTAVMASQLPVLRHFMWTVSSGFTEGAKPGAVPAGSTGISISSKRASRETLGKQSLKDTDDAFVEGLVGPI